MAKIVIKKRVELAFLGEDYKEGYVLLSSIPMREYDAVQKKLDELKNSEDEGKSVGFVRDTVLDRFVEGKFPGKDGLEDLAKDDLLDLPAEFFIQAMSELNGAPSPN